MKSKVLIKAELVLALFIAISILAGKSNIVSLCFYASFVVMMILILMTSRYRSQCKTLALFIIILAFASVIFSAFLHGKFPTIDNMLFFLVFAALLIYIYILMVIDINYSLFKWIMNWGFIFAACFPIAYYIFNIRTYQVGFLSMNFSNSNLLGMWVLQAAIFSFLNFFWQKGIAKKGIIIVLFIVNIRLLVLSGTRNALLALILGGILVLLHLQRKRKYSKKVLFVVAILPILFLLTYLTIFPILNQNGSIIQFSVEGKGLDSRYAIWINTLFNLKGYYLTGDYFSLAGNVHNSHLVVLASYGIIVLLLTILFLYIVMCESNRKCETFLQKICLTAFFVTIFMGIGEGALFSGAVGLYIPSCVYLLLCRYNPGHVCSE